MSANAAAGGSRLLAGLFAGVAGTSAVMGSAAGPWLTGQASGSGHELQTLTSRLEALAKSVNDISKSRGGSTIVVNGSGQNSYKTTTLVAIGEGRWVRVSNCTYSNPQRKPLRRNTPSSFLS